MTPPNPSPDVAGIAARLTKAQREAVVFLDAQPRRAGEHRRPACNLGWATANRPPLVTHSGDWKRSLWALNSAGVAVKAHLLASETPNAD